LWSVGCEGDDAARVVDNAPQQDAMAASLSPWIAGLLLA
jgi:hypothetical protein